MNCKFIILTVLVFLTAFFTKALTLDSCGLDNSPILNKYEVEYLNSKACKNNILQITGLSSKDTFDFTGKKVAFCCGSSGSGISSKKGFFKYIKSLNNGKISSSPLLEIFPFTESEKSKTHGFDCCVSYQYKISIKSRIIENLANKPSKDSLELIERKKD